MHGRHVSAIKRMLMRFIDSCITQLKAQGPSRTCNESKEEEDINDDGDAASRGASRGRASEESNQALLGVLPKP